MIDRRHFLIGAGALLTASFVRRASAFSKKDRQAADCACRPGARGDALRLLASRQRARRLARVTRAGSTIRAAGPDLARASAQPGHPLETDDEIERACRKYDLPVDALDTHLLTAS